MAIERATRGGTRAQLLDWLAAGQRRVADRQAEVASGRRLRAASDDPAAAGEVLGRRRQLDRLAQLGRNSEHAKAWLDTSTSALTDASNLLARSRDLLIQAGNGTASAEGRAALAQELRGIAGELLGLANTTLGGRPVFAGTGAGPRAFTDTGGTTSYDGDGATVTVAVAPDQSLEVGTPGAVFTDALGGTVFDLLRAAADSVAAGDAAAVQTATTAVTTAADRVLGEVGRLGSVSTRLDSLLERGRATEEDAGRRLSQLRDVDLAEALVGLRSAEAGYEATLSATSRLLSTSLLDFLR